MRQPQCTWCSICNVANGREPRSLNPLLILVYKYKSNQGQQSTITRQSLPLFESPSMETDVVVLVESIGTERFTGPLPSVTVYGICLRVFVPCCCTFLHDARSCRQHWVFSSPHFQRNVVWRGGASGSVVFCCSPAVTRFVVGFYASSPLSWHMP